ncbi:DUF1638 domain-containing protein [Candidatus Aerophobetes bacterium]|nr:DUF1638 domain-containing protein [Candidatus Aerophobetes bacterium]
MENYLSFKGYSIVSCGTLRRELNYLRNTGFLDADRILYTAPGLHERQTELERQLVRQLLNARKYSQKIIVVYGERCYLDPVNPFRDIDKVIQEQGKGISRIQARSCIDMLTSAEEREKISQGEKIYWLSPGWIENWKKIFEEWDAAKANETFPQHQKAILLDAVGFFDEYCQQFPEKILEFSDWMKLEIEPYKISLDRFKTLLLGCLENKNGN